MTDLAKNISKISVAVSEWLQLGNESLKLAIEQTADEKLFAMHDIRHRIRHLKQSVTADTLKTWISKTDLITSPLNNQRVLCLHAGNLPLVGFHDLLAVLMTGAGYRGKLSRKDPYLMDSFLQVLLEKNLVDDSSWSADLAQLSSQKVDAVMFSGSEKSVPAVLEALNSLQIAKKHTPKLIRTADFSIAWINDNDRHTMEDLTEAVFRYGGNGCRSVAVVVAPFHLNSQKCTFTDYIESFWLKNPPHDKPDASLSYRFAYNKAIGIEQAWLDHFLIEEYHSLPDDKFVLRWIRGGKEEVEKLINSSGSRLQSVYSNSKIGVEIGSKVTEPLSLAQKPPVWWKADGTDTIRWLIENLKP